MDKPEHGTARPLYGVAIHQCIASGDLDKMKALQIEAEKLLAELQASGVEAGLEALRATIAKIEAGG